MLEHLLSEFCEKLSLKFNPEKDPQGYLSLEINESNSYLIKDLNPGFHLKAPVDTLPKGQHEDLYILLMKANFVGQGTGGGVLSIDGKKNQFVFTLTVTEETTLLIFKEHIESFANYLDYWREKISEYKNLHEKA